VVFAIEPIVNFGGYYFMTSPNNGAPADLLGCATARSRRIGGKRKP